MCERAFRDHTLAKSYATVATFSFNKDYTRVSFETAILRTKYCTAVHAGELKGLKCPWIWGFMDWDEERVHVL